MQWAVDEIRLVGGGAKSPLWSQIVADVFGMPVLRPPGCDASFGAALLAGVGAGLFTDEAEAVQRCTKVSDTVEPDPQAAAVYAQLFPLYCQIHDNLADTYTELARVTNLLERGRKNRERRPFSQDV